VREVIGWVVYVIIGALLILAVIGGMIDSGKQNQCETGETNSECPVNGL
jgi:hypothetical protein